jgi:hypothetical protein
MKKVYADRILSKAESWLKYFSSDRYARLYLEEWDQIQRFCDYLIIENNDSERRKNFVLYIQEYDRRRNTNFEIAFPEYSNLLKDWNA